MNKEQFKEIINQLKTISDYADKYYEFGIDLFEGQFPILNPAYKTIDLLLDQIYTQDGHEWIDWFCYENDFGEKQMEAYDENGKLICQTIDDLFDYIEQYKICK